MKKILFIVLAVALIIGCSSKPTVRIPADQSFKDGLAFMDNEDYEEAVDMFENTVREADNSEMARKAQILIGDAYFMDERYVDAIPAYETYIEIYPDTPDEARAIFRAGLSHYKLQKTIDRDIAATEKALKFFNLLVKKYPKYDENNFKPKEKIAELIERLAQREKYVAEFYLRIKKADCAEGRIVFLGHKYPKSKAYKEINFIAGETFFDRDEYDKAIKYLEKYIELDPNGEDVEDAKDMIKDAKEDYKDYLIRKAEREEEARKKAAKKLLKEEQKIEDENEK